jgi:hypothetical protein
VQVLGRHGTCQTLAVEQALSVPDDPHSTDPMIRFDHNITISYHFLVACIFFQFSLGGTRTFFGANIISSNLPWAVSASLHFLDSDQSLEQPRA